MKKFLSFCIALLFAFVGTVAAQAQSFSYGITAGYNLTKLTFSGSAKENFSSDNKPGWFIGPKVEFNTVIGLGMDASLQYSQRKLNICENMYEASGDILDNDSRSETYRTIEIPINVRYNVGLGKMASVFVYTGPQFGFPLQSMTWNDFGTGANFSKEKMNTTWNIGAGVRLLKHLEANVGYNFALSKAGSAILNNFGVETGSGKSLMKYRTNTFQVQVAYMF